MQCQVIEAKCSENFKLKAGYTAEEQRVRRFSVNKNYCIKDIINKINEKKENNCMYKVFLFHVFKTCTMHYRSGHTEVSSTKAVIKTL